MGCPSYFPKLKEQVIVVSYLPPEVLLYRITSHFFFRHHFLVVPSDASVTRDTDILKSSVMEVKEKLLNVDKCLSGLTNLVAALIKASSNPMTTEATLLLQTIDNICGKKREAVLIDDPEVDLKRIRSLGDASHDDGDFTYYGRSCTDDSDDTNSTSTETLRDCDVKFIPSEFHTDNDFDKFLAYIADDEQPLNYDISASSTGIVPTEYALASASPANELSISGIERVYKTVTPPILDPFTRDHFLHTQFVSSKVSPLQPCESDIPAVGISRYRSSENILHELVSSVKAPTGPIEYPNALHVYGAIEKKPRIERPL
jgi:hypothetical protein